MSVTPHLVADINVNGVGSRPPSLTVVGDDLYIVAQNQFWRHDGQQTTRLSEIESEGVSQQPPAEFGGDVYFVADTYSESPELWRYDGEEVSIAVDLRPGTESEVASEPYGLIRYGGSLYFTADDNVYGRELWRFDGENAEVAANISVVPSHDDGPLVDHGSGPEQIIEHGGSLYFFADDGVQGPALWRFDGAAATMVADVDPENVLGHNLRLLGLTAIGERLYFLAGSYGHLSSEQTLWSFDGQQATPLATLDINGQANDATIVGHADSLYVLLSTSDVKFHLWEYDGSAAAPIVIQQNGYPWNPTGIVYQNALYFALNDPQFGSELHRYNGATIERVTDITPGRGGSIFGELTAYQGKLYFAASDNGNDDVEVWSYDGTTATLAIDLAPGNDSSGASALFVRENTLFLSASDGVSQFGLWSTDGDGASFVGNIGGTDFRYAVVDGDVYSVIRSDEFGYELAVFDGTQNRRITDLCPGACSGVSFAGVVAFGDEIFFAGTQSVGDRIWKYVPSDGTFLEFDALPISSVLNSAVIEGHLYIADNDVVMRYDGTAFEDVTNLFPPRPELKSMTLFEGRWFLNAAQAINDEELWSTDLTPGGSRLEGDLRPGQWGTDPNNLTVWNGALYFIGYSLDYWSANSLWKYQSGEAQIVSGDIDIATSPFDDWLEVFDDKLFFSASRQDLYDHEIWTYDGTEVREAVVLSSGTLQSEDAIPHNFHVFQDALYFTAHTPAYGRELWKLTVDADADLDRDGAVDRGDLAILVGNFGKSLGIATNDGDLDGDGRIGIRDMILLRNAITSPTASAPATVIARASEQPREGLDIQTQTLRAESRVRRRVSPILELVPSAADEALVQGTDSGREITSRRSRLIGGSRR